MSNKVVSLTFRHIIDDVIANVRQDFEDMGIEKEVLEELQRSWEAKLIATQVTEFDGASGSIPGARAPVQFTPGTGPSRAPDTKAKAEPKEESASEKSKAAAGTKRKHEDDDEEASNEIGSDLDDSEEEDADGNEDMMLCLYDKVGCHRGRPPPTHTQVQRVKNKWKCVLRDGVASIGGRDYLFSKCNGEFEW
ncbi:transcription factor IIA subunit alpha [Malassezia obtusa]|uniref:Transcription initiation factor IIA large subunit n=1 Tax=Malassezia obtusa TaxID=76774 RepID=A0AAF0ITH6_9BASI|nr:transcription factor IIA subunit alpha [Malassezia obtusa]